MHTTEQLLLEVKRARGITSDYGLAKYLGIRKQSMSGYRSGTTLGDETACRVADDLGLDRGYVLACMAAERAKGDAAREAWRQLAERAAGVAAGILVAILVAPQLPDVAAPSTVAARPLCITLNAPALLLLVLVAVKIARRQS